MQNGIAHRPILPTMTHWVLILALLVGQSLALGHDHGVHADDDGSCALCLYAQQTAHFIPPAMPCLPVLPVPLPAAKGRWHSCTVVAPPPFRSRAPPAVSC